jgi:hypothetical protein
VEPVEFWNCCCCCCNVCFPPIRSFWTPLGQQTSRRRYKPSLTIGRPKIPKINHFGVSDKLVRSDT